MKKKFWRLALWTLLALLLLPGAAWAADLEISSAADLVVFRNDVNNGNTYEGKTILLTQDIDLQGNENNQWTPIGSARNPFSGTFDGNNKTISGLYINNPDNITGNKQGLFGVVSSGTIKKLTVEGTVLANSYVGGVVGSLNGGNVENCVNKATVGMSAGASFGGNIIGGVVGYMQFGMGVGSNVANCYNTGNISGKGQVGGVVGNISNGNVANCYNTGNIIGGTDNFAGGVVGYMDGYGTVEKCYNTGNVSGLCDIGGVVGSRYDEQFGTITECYYLQGCVTDDRSNTWEEPKTLAEIAGLDCFKTDPWKFDAFLGRPVLKDTPEPTNIIGAGTEANPFEITSAEDLAAFRNAVNSGNTYEGKTIQLTADIDLQGNADNQWTPIGNYNDYNNPKPFKGTFEGNNKTISGLYIEDNSTSGSGYGNARGLFGYVDGGTIQNLTVEGRVSSSRSCGGVVGQLYGGTVQNCTNKVSVNGASYVGGVVGYMDGGTVANCSNTVAVSGADTAGGVVGQLGSGTVQNCTNNAMVNGTAAAGGVVGQLDSGTVQNCYNTSAVSASQYYTAQVGGVVGSISGGTVQNCYNTGAVSANASDENNVGGVVGNMWYGTVDSCYNTGVVNAIGGSRNYAGGVVGQLHSGTVQNCYYNSNNCAAGDSTAGVEGKTNNAFRSGEVAALLQGRKEDQIWGQKIGADNSLPVLRSNLPAEIIDTDNLIVHTVTFGAGENAVLKYANPGGKVELPAAPVQDGYNFVGWRTDSNEPNFTDTTPINENMVLLACYEEKYGANPARPGTSSADYGTEQKLNLAACVKFATDKETAGKFTYYITNNGGINGAATEGDWLTVPADVSAGQYTLTIKASKKPWDIVLLTAAALDTKDFEFAVSITVNRKNLTAAVIADIPAQKYTGSAITPALTVTDGEKMLVADVDYTTAYANSTAVGTATVTVTGKGNYTGALSKSFRIVKQDEQGGGDNTGGEQESKPGYYKITFDTDGGYLVNLSKNTVYVKWGAAYKMPAAGKSRSTLTAWAIGSKDSATRAQANEVYKFTADTTVYAIWQYNGGGGGGGSRPTTPGKPGTTTEKPGTTTEKPGTPGSAGGSITAANISSVFADVQNNAWYAEVISYMYNNGLMQGNADGTFAPNAPLTRAMFVQILYNQAGRPAAGGSSFADVAAGSWYAPAIGWAQERGVVLGYTAERFAPNEGITREQLVVMLWRFAGQPPADIELKFTDKAQVGDWARAALSWAAAKAIVIGDSAGAFNPQNMTTRAEAAQMLVRYLAAVE